MSTRIRNLVWWYPRGGWDGWLPTLSVDEYGYRTLVVPFPGGRALIIGLWRCRDCDAIREQTLRWEAEEADALDKIEAIRALVAREQARVDEVNARNAERWAHRDKHLPPSMRRTWKVGPILTARQVLAILDGDGE